MDHPTLYSFPTRRSSDLRFFDEALVLWPEDDPERASVLFGHGRARFEGKDEGTESLAAARDLFLRGGDAEGAAARSEEHTSELQSLAYLVSRLLHEKKYQ